MDVVPVIDLMDGRVVQGKAGERERYRPIRSPLVAGSDPLAVATALQRATGAPALYVADLDAIMRGSADLATITRLACDAGADLWVDAGVASPAAAKEILATGATRVVIGTETLPDAGALEAIREAVPATSVLLSLDLGDHGLLSPTPLLRGLPPVAALRTLRAEDMTEVLVLTLRRVGMFEGPDLVTLAAVRDAFPQMALVAGGGVRSRDDLAALAQLGAAAVLVATAIHQGAVDAAAVAAVRTR
jgi:phosphoribosylformimino-5-aminoimidazole carboxamide ribotide isomerase